MPPPWEASTLQLESSLHFRQPDKGPHSNKDPVQPKINKYNYFFLKKKFTVTPWFALSHANITHNCLFFCLILILFKPMHLKYISAWKEPSVSNLYSHPIRFSLLLFLILKNTKWSVSHSVVSVCDPMDSSPSSSSVHGILQAIIQKWVAIPFSWGSSWLRDQIWVPYIAGRFFTIWATREALKYYYSIELWSKGQITCRVIWIFKVFVLPSCQKK